MDIGESKDTCHNRWGTSQYASRKVLSLKFSFMFSVFFFQEALLSEDESCWWRVGGRAGGCSVVWMLMNWCSNFLMRSKLSPLSGFVRMKGHLPCRGHHMTASSQCANWSVGVCSISVCGIWGGWHRPTPFSPDSLRFSVWAGGNRMWRKRSKLAKMLTRSKPFPHVYK